MGVSAVQLVAAIEEMLEEAPHPGLEKLVRQYHAETPRSPNIKKLEKAVRAAPGSLVLELVEATGISRGTIAAILRRRVDIFETRAAAELGAFGKPPMHVWLKGDAPPEFSMTDAECLAEPRLAVKHAKACDRPVVGWVEDTAPPGVSSQVWGQVLRKAGYRVENMMRTFPSGTQQRRAYAAPRKRKPKAA